MSLIRLAWVHFKIGTMNEFQYRVNFFIQLVQSALALATGLVALTLVFSHTSDLNGWGRSELLAVMGIHILMGGLIQATIQPNMGRIMTDVEEGTLDYALTKPADAQVLVSVREVRIWRSVDIVIGLVLIVFAMAELGEGVGLLDAMAFGAALIMGGLMIYSFWLMITSGAFWVVRMYFLVELFDGIYQAGRWPVGIYPLWLRGGLTFLVPVAFAVTVPAESLTDRLTAPARW